MTYDSYETGVETGRPVEVYEFAIGGTTYRYTSSESEETIGASTYTPRPVQRGQLPDSGPDGRGGEFEVELPTTDPVAQVFAGDLPGVRMTLTVKRFHRDDLPTPEVVTIFEGVIETAAFRDNLKRCVLACKTIIGAAGIQIPRRTYAGPCSNFLYDEFCQVSDTDPAFRAASVPVSAQMGSVLTVSGISGTYTDGWFDGGYVEVVGSSDFRDVVEHVGNQLTLLNPFGTVPSTVNVFAGCDRSIDGAGGCGPKFSNVPNFGGCAWVPRINVFQTGVK